MSGEVNHMLILQRILSFIIALLRKKNFCLHGKNIGRDFGFGIFSKNASGTATFKHSLKN